MNRKQLRRVVCGLTVILTLGGSLLSQASGEGGLMARLWDRRPRLSESKLNPRNWFRSRADDASPAETVVAVRPELTRNPFVASASPAGEAADAESSSQRQQPRDSAEADRARSSSGEVAESSHRLPEVVPKGAQGSLEGPPPRLSAIIRRPSADMIERARNRKVARSRSVGHAADDECDADRESPAGVAAQAPGAGPNDSQRVAAARLPEASEDRQALETGTPLAGTSADDRKSGRVPRRTLMRMPVPVEKTPSEDRTVTERQPIAGRVRMTELAAGSAGAPEHFDTSKPPVRSVARRDAGRLENDGPDTARDGGTAGASAYERLLAQINSAGTRTDIQGTATSRPTAPLLPDSFSGGLADSPATHTSIAAGATGDGRLPEIDEAAGHPTASVGDSRAESDAHDDSQPSIDEMIARSREEMSRTFLARQAQRDRSRASGPASQVAAGAESPVSQTGAVVTGSAPPLMIPGGFEQQSFRTYGERERVTESSGPNRRNPTSPARTDHSPSDLSGRSRLEQAVRSVQGRTAAPAINLGPVGSGVVIQGSEYSAVRPRVSSNTGRSLSVPADSEFRRLSYERRTEELSEQVNQLGTVDSTAPVLVMPGEKLPEAGVPERSESRHETNGSALNPPATGSPIDWPDDDDLAPVKPRAGETSWGLIILCLALLVAGGHIGISRFRQSRTAAAACRS